MKVSWQRSIILLFICFYACKNAPQDNQYNTDQFRIEEGNNSQKISVRNPAENNDYITVSFDRSTLSTKTTADYSELIDTVFYIPLETNIECPISIIDQIIIFNQNIYLTDWNTKQLYKFNNKGEFLKRVGDMGRGPEERLTLSHFEIINDEIVIWDGRSNQMFYYDLDGIFVRKQSIPMRMSQFARVDDSLFVADIATRGNFHLKELVNSKLLFFTNNWKVEGKGDHYNAAKETDVSFARKVLRNTPEGLLYNPSVDYYIYTIDSDWIKRKYFIDVGDMRIPDGAAIGETLDGFSAKYLGNNQFTYVARFVETRDHLVLSLLWNNTHIPLFYSKNTGNTRSFRYFKPVSIYPIPIAYPIGQTDSLIIGSIAAVSIVGYLDQTDSTKPPCDPLVKEVFTRVRQEDNPVIVLLKLREF